MPIDAKSLPEDPKILQQMLVDLTAQLDKTQRYCASYWLPGAVRAASR